MAARAERNLSTFASDPYHSFTNLIQASDGNFYAVSDSFGLNAAAVAGPGCPDGSANDCDFILKITPDGAVTILHTFERDAKTSASGVSDRARSSRRRTACCMAQPSKVALRGTELFSDQHSGVYTTPYTFPADGSGDDPKASSHGAPFGVYPVPWFWEIVAISMARRRAFWAVWASSRFRRPASSHAARSQSEGCSLR